MPERLNMYVKLSKNTTSANNLEQPVIDFLKSKGFEMSEENLLHRAGNGIVLDVRVRTSTRDDTNMVEINCWIDKE